MDLIKEFEGLYLQAYLDPVGVPTIGYGTIRYPDGNLVRMGDRISKAEADAFLRDECDKVSRDILKATAGIALNQNQLDALISFCFNLGIGALLSSTLLKKLKAGDFKAAAKEFPRWNKATDNGVKIELPGLTKRRAKERALFEKATAVQASAGGAASPRESVVRLRAFGDAGGGAALAAYDDASKVVEILKLDGASPAAVRAALSFYPHLRTFEIAVSNENVPAGQVVKLSGVAPAMPKEDEIPALQAEFLALGADDEQNGTNDVRNLQIRLRDLGYLEGTVDGRFGAKTDAAVRAFQSDFFGLEEADGKVGILTWTKLWGDAKAPAPQPPPPGPAPAASAGKNFLKLTKTDRLFPFGCVVLDLAYYRNGQAVGSISVCSGQGTRQNFRKGAASPSGSMEPIPEGLWRLHDAEWADGKDNYSGGIWNNGLGPVKIRLDYIKPKTTEREDIEIHIDWNRDRSPGTAGCVGLQSIADFKRLVTWLRETDPRDLYVDWGLGSCPAP